MARRWQRPRASQTVRPSGSGALNTKVHIPFIGQLLSPPRTATDRRNSKRLFADNHCQPAGHGSFCRTGHIITGQHYFRASKRGTKSQPQNITLTNTGTSTLTIKGITAAPQFFTETSTCAGSLASSASCTISDVFQPSLQGILAGSLSVQDDGLNGEHRVSLSRHRPVATSSSANDSSVLRSLSASLHAERDQA